MERRRGEEKGRKRRSSAEAGRVRFWPVAFFLLRAGTPRVRVRGHGSYQDPAARVLLIPGFAPWKPAAVVIVRRGALRHHKSV